jgi:hypothetical protein
MGSIDKRLEDLERLLPPPEDEEAQLRRAVTIDILDEIASLGACRARNRYRGGTPPTPIQPTDPVGDSLGYPYTRGERTEFAIKRVIERRDFPEEESGEIVARWVAFFRELDRELDRERGGDRWDEVGAEGAPEPTPPWH